MSTDEEIFQAERLSGIGGSDVGDMFSIGTYGCELRLIYEKQAIHPDYEITESSRRAMRRGVKLEDVIADEYAEVTGRKVQRTGLKRHKDYPFLMVHMDRLVWRDDRFDPGYLEIKAPGYGMIRNIKRDGLPEGWQLQVQHGMLVAEMDWGSFAVMDIPNWKVIHFDVDADFGIQEMIIEKALELWPKVSGNGPLPEKFPPQDTRCRKCEYRYRCHGNSTSDFQLAAINDEYVPDAETVAMVMQVLEYQDIEDEAHKLNEDAKERLKEMLEGKPARFKIPGAWVNYLKFNKTTWDHDALNAYMEMNPRVAQMFAKFRKTTPQEQLRIERI